MQRLLTHARRQELLDEAIAIIERDYAEDLSLDELARRIATSRRQLQRCFTEHHDGTFRSCLTRVRMERAAGLLLTTPASVREVARRVGYRQPPQFAKAFSRQHGATPSEFRARAGAATRRPVGEGGERRQAGARPGALAAL